ncbi:MAG TPA: alkaline phosphatase [Saprospirales bacterium]|nr:alkaline phosphatase [Saprospirales bacterium]
MRTIKYLPMNMIYSLLWRSINRKALSLSLVLIHGCSSVSLSTTGLYQQEVIAAKRPKNIIFLIGDGMATAQVSAHIYWSGVGKTIFEQFPIVGFHKSHASDYLVTDSAAGATAFACGQKTKVGAIGVVPPDDQPCKTILEELDDQGMATGIVTTCTATHATPACYISHLELRALTEEIAVEYLNTSFDCLIAGGENLFNKRYDNINLIDSLKNRGYVVRRGTGFRNLPLDGSRPFVNFTHEMEPPTASGGRTYLPIATSLACEFLQKRSDQGFFLMVEGSQIDWACHTNDKNWLKAEMADFDKTIRAALNFAIKDGETLVVVPGDHECGGLALGAQGNSKKYFHPLFSTRVHSAAMVPVYAFGPGAELFSGTYENTEIYFKMREALGR